MVVAHASAATLAACLGSLPVRRLHGVVVVDNASPDDSARVARGVPGVQVIEQDNLGFGAGCNAGTAALPGAELLLFLNPDAVVGPEDLAALVEHLDRDPRCGIVGPRLFRGQEPLTSAGSAAGVRSELRTVVPTALSSLLPDRRLPAEHDRTGPVGYVEGACFLVRASLLREVGGFDESFFLFFEEMDLARRFAVRGATTWLLASARAQHLSAVSRRTLPDGGRAHLLRSTVLHLHRCAPWKARVYVLLARAAFAVRRRGGLAPEVATAWSDAVRGALQACRAPAAR